MKINNNVRLLFYKILMLFLIIGVVIIVNLIIIKKIKRKNNEEKNKDIVYEFKELLKIKNNSKTNSKQKEKKEIFIEFEGYKVIGIIKIPKIDLEYPILEQTTKATMNTSISRYWGNEINSLGNVSLAGHNNYDGTMFGKNKNLNILDVIELTDLYNLTVQYEIYDIFTTHPNNVSILKTTNNKIREVTLITCTNGRKERLIIKAHEIKK